MNPPLDVDWPALLHTAADGCDMRAFHQPIVDLTDGHVAGYQALIRFVASASGSARDTTSAAPPAPGHQAAPTVTEPVRREIRTTALRPRFSTRTATGGEQSIPRRQSNGG